jgi:AraC-like DNA-binding protein
MQVRSTEAVSEEYIHLNSCGCQHLSGKDISLLRPNGRVDYHILYITEGVCFVTLDGVTHAAAAGSLIFFFPGERQNYAFRADIPSTSYYLHFSGTSPAVLLGKIERGEKRIFPIGKSATIEELLRRAEEEYTLSLAHAEGVAGGYLLSLLSLFLRKIKNAKEQDDTARSKIAEAAKRMHATLSEELPISHYAEGCHLSESRFTHLFHEVMGESPLSYLTKARIRRAQELLTDTPLPVSAVGEAVGIKSPYYFSRIFKKYTGVSPAGYRKKTGD